MILSKWKLQVFNWALFFLVCLPLFGCHSREEPQLPNPISPPPVWSWHGIVPGQTTKDQAMAILEAILPVNAMLEEFRTGISWYVQIPTELAGYEDKDFSYVLTDQGVVEQLQIWEPNGTLADAVSAHGTPTLVVNALLGFEDPRQRVGFAYPEKGLVLMTSWGPPWDPETQEMRDAGMGIIPQPEMLVLQTYYSHSASHGGAE